MQHHLLLQITNEAAPTVRVSRQSQAAIMAPPAINVGSGIGRVAKHVAERRAIRPVPVDVTLLRPAPSAIGKGNVMVDEISKNPADRAAPLEEAEDEANDPLDPFVRIQSDFAGWLQHIASRET
jgi:hypothetical protein